MKTSISPSYIFLRKKKITKGTKDKSKKDNKQLIVCLGYNETKNFFSIAFFALLQSKSFKAYETLHINIKLLIKFSPEFITVDFEQAHIKVIFYLKKIEKII